MSAPVRTLSPRAARVFYALADACSDAAEDPFARCDPARSAALRALADDERRRVERGLFLLEWSPRLALRSRRGFAWLERGARRAWLDRLAQARRPWLARRVGALRSLAVRALAEADAAPPHSVPGP